MKDNIDMPLFPLITALAGYRLIVIDTKQIPGLTETDIMISRTLYNKMKNMCPDLFEDNKIKEL